MVGRDCAQSNDSGPIELFAGRIGDGGHFAIVKALAGDFEGRPNPAACCIIPKIGIHRTAYPVMIGLYRCSTNLQHFLAHAVDVDTAQLAVAAVEQAGLIDRAKAPPTGWKDGGRRIAFKARAIHHDIWPPQIGGNRFVRTIFLVRTIQAGQLIAAPSFFAAVAIGKADGANLARHIDGNADIGDVGIFGNRHTMLADWLAIHQDFKLCPPRCGGCGRVCRDSSAAQDKGGSKQAKLESAFGRHRKASFNECAEEYPA
ncbi:MAG: hypothetical protein RL145_1018, partial [Pseudomonadota bacterium]